MEHYDFEVLKGDETIAVARSVALPDPRAAWPRVAELAKNVGGPGCLLANNVGEPGCLIRVTNEAGEVVVLVGIAVARRIATDVSFPRLAPR